MGSGFKVSLLPIGIEELSSTSVLVTYDSMVELRP